ncbi:MAG TPA: DsrH/TusB family sulfur metabolism protein [Candidatus Lokiarchaeia archaeon]|nr:DsrH/TusB family sulfur metabolism protein [Candidatus Lokiarchaeia archaeon]
MTNNLYLIGRSPAEDPFTRVLVDTILVLAKNGATGLHVHLLQDGVLAARKQGTWVSRILQMLDLSVVVTVQEEDVRARGSFELPEGCQKISYADIIDAIFDSERICSAI